MRCPWFSQVRIITYYCTKTFPLLFYRYKGNPNGCNNCNIKGFHTYQYVADECEKKFNCLPLQRKVQFRCRAQKQLFWNGLLSLVRTKFTNKLMIHLQMQDFKKLREDYCLEQVVMRGDLRTAYGLSASLPATILLLLVASVTQHNWLRFKSNNKVFFCHDGDETDDDGA